jgi:hypothetical protein
MILNVLGKFPFFSEVILRDKVIGSSYAVARHQGPAWRNPQLHYCENLRVLSCSHMITRYWFSHSPLHIVQAHSLVKNLKASFTGLWYPSHPQDCASGCVTTWSSNSPQYQWLTTVPASRLPAMQTRSFHLLEQRVTTVCTRNVRTRLNTSLDASTHLIFIFIDDLDRRFVYSIMAAYRSNPHSIVQLIQRVHIL